MRGSGRSSPRVHTRERVVGRVHDLQAERPGQVDALGAPVQHRLRADVDDHPADRAAPQLSTDLVGTLEDHHLVPGVVRSRAAVSPATPAPTTAILTGPASQVTVRSPQERRR